MMNDIQSLSNLWQKDYSSVIKKEINQQDIKILNKLEKHEKNQIKLAKIKITTVAICLFCIYYTIVSNGDFSSFILAGLAWISLTIILGMIYFWQKQFRVSKQDYKQNTLDFIKETTSKLKSETKMINQFVPLFVISLVIGLNLIYIDLLKDQNDSQRLLMHLGFSVFCILIAFMALQIRKKRYQKTFMPLIDELAHLKKSIENEEL